MVKLKQITTPAAPSAAFMLLGGGPTLYPGDCGKGGGRGPGYMSHSFGSGARSAAGLLRGQSSGAPSVLSWSSCGRLGRLVLAFELA